MVRSNLTLKTSDPWRGVAFAALARNPTPNHAESVTWDHRQLHRLSRRTSVALRFTRNHAVVSPTGADGTRVFTVSSVLGPAKAQRCQAGPRLNPAARVRASETTHGFPAHVPRPQLVLELPWAKPCCLVRPLF